MRSKADVYAPRPKDVTISSCCNFEVYEPILTIFGRTVFMKVSTQKIRWFTSSWNQKEKKNKIDL